MKRRQGLIAGLAGLAPLAGPAGFGLWLPAGARAATPGIELPPEAGPPRPLQLPDFAQATLDNGLRIVVAPRARLPLVSVSVLLLAGREADPAGRAGLASTTVDLLGKGALRGGRPVGATELARQAEALGGTLDSGSGWRSASIGMTVTTPKLPAALALLADLVRRPLLDAEELERARAQALDGLRLTLANPGEVAGLVARRIFWGDGPWAASPTPASLQRIVRDDVRAFHEGRYRPERCIVVLAGAVSAREARALVQSRFGDWRPRAAAAPAIVAMAPAPIAQRTVFVDMPGSGQSGVVITAPFSAMDAADRRIGDVASAVLGAGYSSRLNLEVRIKRGLSYGVGAGAETQPGGGMWSARAQTQHATAAQVLELMRDETLKLGREAPAAEELAARQATLVGSFARRLETTAGIASVLGGHLAQGRPLTELARYAEMVLAVTPAQVQDFAARHWSAEALRSVVAGDLGAAGEALRQVDAQALVRRLDGIDLERADLGSR